MGLRWHYNRISALISEAQKKLGAVRGSSRPSRLSRRCGLRMRTRISVSSSPIPPTGLRCSLTTPTSSSPGRRSGSAQAEGRRGAGAHCGRSRPGRGFLGRRAPCGQGGGRQIVARHQACGGRKPVTHDADAAPVRITACLPPACRRATRAAFARQVSLSSCSWRAARRCQGRTRGHIPGHRTVF